MRIVQMVENLERGGLERMALDLAIGQKALGHTLSIYCLHDRGALAEEAEAAGIRVTAFDKPPGFSVKTIHQMWRAMKRDAIDVVQTHNPGIHHYGAIAGKLAGAHFVLSTRHSPLNSKGRPYQERYFRWVLPWTDAVVCVCDHTRRQLAEPAALPADKTSVIINGINLTPYRDLAARPGSFWPRVRFGTVGRLVPAKAHSILLDAFAAVRAQLPQAELHLAGYGELEAPLREQAARLGFGESVFTLRRVSAAEAPAFYASLDVFVLSSVNEGLPLVILEAMAAGLPIVSTRVGGVPEVAVEGENAWLCQAGSAEALAATMLAAAASGATTLAQRGAAARAKALSSHGVEHMTASYQAVIDQKRR